MTKFLDAIKHHQRIMIPRPPASKINQGRTCSPSPESHARAPPFPPSATTCAGNQNTIPRRKKNPTSRMHINRSTHLLGSSGSVLPNSQSFLSWNHLSINAPLCPPATKTPLLLLLRDDSSWPRGNYTRGLVSASPPRHKAADVVSTKVQRQRQRALIVPGTADAHNILWRAGAGLCVARGEGYKLRARRVRRCAVVDRRERESSTLGSGRDVCRGRVALCPEGLGCTRRSIRGGLLLETRGLEIDVDLWSGIGSLVCREPVLREICFRGWGWVGWDWDGDVGCSSVFVGFRWIYVVIFSGHEQRASFGF